MPPHAGPAPRRSEGPSSPREEAIAPRTEKSPQDPDRFTKVSMPEYVVEPPDLLLVEVLEALPGRPITGERLVRPDGKITLGFYGEVYVAGLTTTEIKEKIVLHLRKFLPDEVLGLSNFDPKTDQPRPVEPRDTDRVFVDVTAYNSKVYYVQGDVAQPGRLPITGNETVLDAIQLLGGPDPDGGPAEHPPRPPRPQGGLLRAGPAGQPGGDHQRRRPDDQLPAHAQRPPRRLPRPEGRWASPGHPDRPVVQPGRCPPHPIRCLADRSPAHRGGTKARPAPGGRGRVEARDEGLNKNLQMGK